MDTIKVANKKNVKMVAHRGVSGLERENTCPAFVAAGNRSYFGVETDVHETSDGKFVIMHDDTLARVSGGEYNVNVEKSRFEELSDIVLPDLDGSKIRRDIKVPLLAEYISICKKYEKICVLELKGFYEKESLERMTDEIRSLGYLDSMIFISFSFENCVKLREVLPEARIQFLWEKRADEELIAKLKKYNFGLDVYFGSLTKDTVELLHENGIEVNCWTVDDPTAAEKLVEMGVDYITSNILE